MRLFGKWLGRLLLALLLTGAVAGFYKRDELARRLGLLSGY